jgi:hypothetical protein
MTLEYEEVYEIDLRTLTPAQRARARQATIGLDPGRARARALGNLRIARRKRGRVLDRWPPSKVVRCMRLADVASDAPLLVRQHEFVEPRQE